MKNLFNQINHVKYRLGRGESLHLPRDDILLFF